MSVRLFEYPLLIFIYTNKSVLIPYPAQDKHHIY